MIYGAWSFWQIIELFRWIIPGVIKKNSWNFYGGLFFGLEISWVCNTILHNFVGWNFRYFFKNFQWQSNKPKISGFFSKKDMSSTPALSRWRHFPSFPCGCWKLEIILDNYSLSYEQKVWISCRDCHNWQNLIQKRFMSFEIDDTKVCADDMKVWAACWVCGYTNNRVYLYSPITTFDSSEVLKHFCNNIFYLQRII